MFYYIRNGSGDPLNSDFKTDTMDFDYDPRGHKKICTERMTLVEFDFFFSLYHHRNQLTDV